MQLFCVVRGRHAASPRPSDLSWLLLAASLASTSARASSAWCRACRLGSTTFTMRPYTSRARTHRHMLRAALLCFATCSQHHGVMHTTTFPSNMFSLWSRMYSKWTHSDIRWRLAIVSSSTHLKLVGAASDAAALCCAHLLTCMLSPQPSHQGGVPIWPGDLLQSLSACTEACYRHCQQCVQGCSLRATLLQYSIQGTSVNKILNVGLCQSLSNCCLIVYCYCT